MDRFWCDRCEKVAESGAHECPVKCGWCGEVIDGESFPCQGDVICLACARALNASLPPPKRFRLPAVLVLWVVLFVPALLLR